VPPQSQKTIARSLGQFVGHILHGVRTPVGGASETQTVQVSRETQTQGRVTPMGMVTVRRTVIEEVELPAAAPRTDAGHPGSAGGH
jgi:hypothetical protein